MKRNSQLDERQEQLLLQIEHNGCWFVFWGLLVSIFIQIFIYGYNIRYILGEWIIFMTLAIYIGIACMRNGIWDRHLKADPETNVIISLIAGLATGFFTFMMVYRNHPDKIMGSIAAGVFMTIVTFTLCFISVSIALISYRKRQKALEKEPEEGDV